MSGRKKWSFKRLNGRTAAMLLLAVLFALGGMCGCLAASAFYDTDGALTAYVHGYLTLAGQGSVNAGFSAVLWQTLRFALLAAVMGLTVFGAIGIPALFAFKGFALCYSVSVFYRLLGLKGLAIGAILFGLSMVIQLPVLLDIGERSLLCSYGLLRRSLGEGRYPLGIDRSFLPRCAIAVTALFLCAGIEYLAVPVLLQKFAGLFLSG